MNFPESFRSATKALLANKVRSFLTMLGVIIGVFAVVTLVSLVKGLENFIVDRFNALGSNLILVSPGNISPDSDPGLAFTNNRLEEKHLDIIEKYADDYVFALTPNIRMNKIVTRKTQSYFASVLGVDHNANEIVDITLDIGRFFTQSEVRNSKKVAVIAPRVKEELFKEVDPLGQEIKIEDASFEIVGVSKPKGRLSDDRVILPYTTAMKYFGVTNFSGITIGARDGVDLAEARRQVKYALRRELKDDEFTVFTQQDILKSVGQILGVLSAALAAIAGISLLVGGIGIMNIMLVSVTERTQEIGLRKALGATAKNIGTQFVMEALIIGLIGGTAGLTLAFLTTLVIRQFIRATVPLWGVALGLMFSIAVGVVFGTYPALKAAKKDPVVALGYE